MNPSLTEYKDRFFEILLSNNQQQDFLDLIDQLSIQGHTKTDIYNLFLDFHVNIQVDVRTKDNEEIYDWLCDFMDGFTAWGKHFKILPNEPDQG